MDRKTEPVTQQGQATPENDGGATTPTSGVAATATAATASTPTPAAVLTELETILDGLTSAEAARRLERDGPNVLPKKKRDNIFQVFFRQMMDPIVLILVVTVIFSLVVGEITDAIAIVFIIMLDLVLGTFQEWKAEKNADSLSSIIKVPVVVLRDGREQTIDSSEIVVGDVMLLSPGDKLSADAYVYEAHNLTVNESVLTGESVNVMKTALGVEEEVDDKSPLRRHTLFAGTGVVTGRAKAVVFKTGINTEVGQIADTVASTKDEKSPLTLRMEKFSRQISVLIVAVAAVIAVLLMMKGEALEAIFLSVIALAVSAMPEGLPLALTMALTVTSNRMMKQKCLVKKLNSVESLGSCTYIASDKTGTLTVNEQTAKKIVFPDGAEAEITGAGYNFEGEVRAGQGTADAAELAARVKAIAELGTVNSEARLEKTETGYDSAGDSIDIAFLALRGKVAQGEALPERVGLIPYESENQYSAAFYRDATGQTFATVKGSLEVVLGFCEGADQARIHAQNEALAKAGYRVIAIAAAAAPQFEEKSDYTAADLPRLEFKGLVAFIDPIREDAKASIQECQEAGINVVMITGDHPLTALAIARELGLCRDEQEVITGDELAALVPAEGDPADSAEFVQCVQSKKVFARVTPMDKLNIVNALKKAGEFVAVTGDGVNDAPALKVANIGVAMGSGTDVAKETADMIILDDRFSSIVNGVREGRGAYSNIRKICFMLLSCGMAEVLFFLLAIAFDLPMPLVAIQLLWLNIVTDGLQDFALSFEKPERGVMQEPPRKTTDTLFNRELLVEVLVAGLTMGLIVFAVWRMLLASGMAVEVARGYIMALMVFMQNIHVLSCRSERTSVFKLGLKNKWVIFAIGSSILLQILVMEIPFLSQFLETTDVPFLEMLELLGFSLIILLVMELFKVLKRQRLELQQLRARLKS